MIISGLKETVMKRYTVERTDKAENSVVRPNSGVNSRSNGPVILDTKLGNSLCLNSLALSPYLLEQLAEYKRPEEKSVCCFHV